MVNSTAGDRKIEGALLAEQMKVEAGVREKEAQLQEQGTQYEALDGQLRDTVAQLSEKEDQRSEAKIQDQEQDARITAMKGEMKPTDSGKEKATREVSLSSGGERVGTSSASGHEIEEVLICRGCIRYREDQEGIDHHTW